MMRRSGCLITSVVCVLLIVGGSIATTMYLKQRNRTEYRTVKVARRDVTMVVNSTGEIKPVLSVSIGSFVSGPILELNVDYNDRVAKDQILAKIDPRIYEAAVARDAASLATRVAEVERVEAELQRAMNNERRSIALRAESKDYISEAEIDQFHFARTSLEAQLKVAKAAIDQAKANLSNSEANLAYTEIRSPVEGIVIDKKIDPGQTLAAQFQTPELFIVAPEMEEKMHVFASVDEADIGFIRAAQEAGHKVEFTVDAYPDDLFEGQIEQIRFSSTVTQNVVMYPVVVSAPNPDLKLLPGMTADLSFQVEAKKDVICIPNAALRFFPNAQQVREADRKLLDGAAREEAEQTDSESSEQENSSAKERIEAGIERNQRHVWVQEGKFLKAILVTTGISDFQYTEVLSGDLEVEQELVVGIKPKP